MTASVKQLQTVKQKEAAEEREQTVAVLEKALALARDGKFTGVFVVGQFRDPTPDGYLTYFSQSQLFNRVEAIGYLDIFRHRLVRELLDE